MKKREEIEKRKEKVKEIIKKMKEELVIKKEEQPKNSRPASEILYEMRYK